MSIENTNNNTVADEVEVDNTTSTPERDTEQEIDNLFDILESALGGKDSLGDMNQFDTDKAMQWFYKHKIKFTFKSVAHLLENHNVTLNSLRACAFKRSDNTLVFDVIKQVILLIEAGLIGGGADVPPDKLEDLAYDIIEDWSEHFGGIISLHVLLITKLEGQGFFMNIRDVPILRQLKSKSSTKVLLRDHLRQEQASRQTQTMAYQY